MRLGTLLLSAAVAAGAQVPGTPPGKELPWAAARVLPWTPGPASSGDEAPPVQAPAARPQADAPAALPGRSPAPASGDRSLAVTLSTDGALRITDDKGTIQLRSGLPGRPLKLWRDGGTVLDPSAGLLRFPAHTPLLSGIGGLRLGSADFRPALEGLLWLLDDDERVITIVHPATARMAFLPLPGGRDITLVFYADRLEVQRLLPGPPPRPEAVSWSLPWLALLPQFIQLGQAKARPAREGTALVPFPRE